MTTQAPHDEGTRHPGRGRTVIVWLLIVLASLSALTASLTVWVKRQAFNTDAWVKASDQVLDDPQVRQVLSAYLVDQLYQNVDVGGQLKELLPADFKNL